LADFTKLFVNSKTGQVESIGATKITALDMRGNKFRLGTPEIADDANFFVSGAIGAKINSKFGLGVFGGDLVVSGALIAEKGMSGSLTRLTDGSSYIIGGSNITIVSASNGAVTISANVTVGATVKEALSKETGPLTASYALQNVPDNINNVQVYVNGLLRLSGSDSDYTATLSPTASIVFTGAGIPQSGSIVQAVYVTGSSDSSGGSGGGTSDAWQRAGTTVRLVNIDDLVGIGTASPEAKLEVSKDVDPNDDLNDPTDYQLVLRHGAQTNNKSAGIGFTVETAAENIGAAIIHNRDGNFSQGNLQFYTKNSTTDTADPELAMTITNAQRVGIGVSTPAAKLEIEVADSDNLAGVLIDSDETGGHYAFEVDAESTSNPAAYIHGYGTLLEQDISSGYGLKVTRDIAEGGSNPLVEIHDDNTNNTQTSLKVRQDGSGDIINLFDGSTEVFTVVDGGNTGIGTASPNEQLTVEGVLSLDETSAPSATSGYGKIYVKDADSKLYFKDDGGTEFDLTAAATAGAPTNAQYVVLAAASGLSDERVITQGNGISIEDAGAGGALTISASINSDDFAFSGGSLNLAVQVIKSASADTGTADGASHTLTFAGGEGIDTSAAGSTITIAGELAGTSNKGVASFATADFNVSSGHVSLDDDVLKNIATDSGTAGGSTHAVTIEGGTGIDTSGAGSTITLDIDDGVVATISGANFEGNVGVDGILSVDGDATVLGNLYLSGNVSAFTATGSVEFNAGLSGSLTHLTDGTSYLLAGRNVTIASASNGQITINASPLNNAAEMHKEMLSRESAAGVTDYTLQNTPSDGLQVQVYVNGLLMLSGSPYDYTYDSGNNQIDFEAAPISGSTIQAIYTITGTQEAPAGNNTEIQFNDFGNFGGDSAFTFNKTTNTMTVTSLSGALTRLSDGKSYIAAGANITIASATNGQITISSTAEGGGASDFFSSTTAGSMFTTGAVAFVGGQTSPSAPDAPSDVGNDVFFFVSGSIGSQGTSVTGSSLFGGDLVVSGNFNAKKGIGTLATATSVIHVSASAAPSSGSILVAKTATEAVWQQAIVFGETPSGTKNGTNVTFSLAGAPINNTDLMLFVNGLLQLSGAASDYTLTGSEINFGPGLAPLSEDILTAIYRPSA
jgi:hypothetical protein